MKIQHYKTLWVSLDGCAKFLSRRKESCGEVLEGKRFVSAEMWISRRIICMYIWCCQNEYLLVLMKQEWYPCAPPPLDNLIIYFIVICVLCTPIIYHSDSAWSALLEVYVQDVRSSNWETKQDNPTSSNRASHAPITLMRCLVTSLITKLKNNLNWLLIGKQLQIYFFHFLHMIE